MNKIYLSQILNDYKKERINQTLSAVKYNYNKELEELPNKNNDFNIKNEIEDYLNASQITNNLNKSINRSSPSKKSNIVTGRNYNYKNKNNNDEVGKLLIFDTSFKNPSLIYENENEEILKINRKDYIEHISKPTIQFNYNQTDITNYEIFKKKFINYIHFNIHSDSKDEKIISMASKIREFENKKFCISQHIKNPVEKNKFKKAIERRIISSFDEVIYLYIYN